MKRAWHWLARSLEWCGAFLLALVSLPFIALTYLLLRSVLLATVIAGLFGVVTAYCVSPRFRHWAGQVVHAAK